MFRRLPPHESTLTASDVLIAHMKSTYHAPEESELQVAGIIYLHFALQLFQWQL